MDPLTLAYLLILLGIVFLILEMFVPSGGLLAILAVCSLVAGVAMTFIYADSIIVGGLTLLGLIILLPVLGGAAFYYWPKTPIGRCMFLAAEPEMSQAVPNTEFDKLKGRYGKALSALRPAGVVDFDGKRIDCMSEGPLIEPGQWVKCVDVRGGRVLVRQSAKPDVSQLENAEFT